MNYTFGVMTYNQEDYVIETLESIKNQIINYGRNTTFSLIVGDDASKDNTVLYVRKWLECNEKIFTVTKIITHDHNVGTVKNYQEILSCIEDDNFKVLAGDDVYACGNFLKDVGMIDVNTMVTMFPLYLQEGILSVDKKKLVDFYYCYTKERLYKYNLRRIKMGGYVHTPSTFVNKRLYTENCIKFMSKFSLFEDDPMWYIMVKDNSELDVEFIGNVAVLYRIHSASVSNGSKNMKFIHEYNEMKKIFISEEKNCILKLYMLMQLISNKYLDFSNYINYFRYLYKRGKVYNDSNYLEYLNKIENICKINQEYYRKIKEKSDEFKVNC